MACEMSHPPAADPSSKAQDVPALLPDGRPDWDAIAFDVFCSRCEYNLKTLTRPLCPECGLEFDWRVVLDDATWRSDFLFEHHWQKRPVRSWLKTVWESFRPARFWSQVSIHHRIQAGPLWFMLGFSVIPFLVIRHATAGIGWLIVDKLLLKWLPPAYFGPWVLEGIAGRFRHITLLPFADFRTCLRDAATLWLILLAALTLLCSLRQTLGRCRVRSIHILRIISCVSTPVLVLCALWVDGYNCLVQWPVLLDSEGFMALGPALLMLTPPTIFALFLGVGLKRYLQLPRAWLLAIVTVIVSFLFIFTGLTVFVVLSQGGWG
jgi:hypothetical protein